jgi:Flp pilus assembly protein TadG
MRYTLNGNCRRRGAVAPLAALLAAFLIGMVAFAVDIGWMVLVKADLQNAADAAALSGVKPLMDGYVNYSLTLSSAQKTNILNAAMTSAKANAKTYAGYNAAGGVSSLTLNDSDIEFGFTDGSGNYTTLANTSNYPNTIKVTLRRDSQANGALGLYFGSVFGVKSVSLTASAAGTMYGGQANNFSSNPSSNVYILPATYDVNMWNTFVQTGLNPDGVQTIYQSNPALLIYPTVNGPGNFGQLSLDDNHVGAPVEKGWVDNGIGSTEIQALQQANLIPLSSHNPNNWDWVGDTGMKQTLVADINSQPVGKQYLLPLFNPKNNGVPNPATYQAGVGQGSNFYYQIVQFVGITIVPSNGVVVVQPCAIIDPNIVFSGSGPVPVGSGSTNGQLITIFAAPKLTQ